MKSFLIVFIGSGIGGIFRFGLNTIIDYLGQKSYIGTFLSNILAALILGIFLSWNSTQNQTENNFRLLIAIGICGGFSTMSSFSFELFEMIKNAQHILLLVYLLSTICLSIFMIFLGFTLHQKL
jgi:CrcB protein